MEAILSSKSPRRAKILRMLGLKFMQHIPGVDENFHIHFNPGEMVKKRAVAKAADAAWRYPDALVIGADTAVVIGKKALGKPHGIKEAREMIGALPGKTVIVITAVAIVCEKHDLGHVWLEKASVKFKKTNAKEIGRYIKSGKWKGKAGGFNVNEAPVGGWVKKISGERETVAGLPIKRLARLLRAYGLI